jgi:RNA polymerase sigma-70 factor (ECF subfamily)
VVYRYLLAATRDAHAAEDLSQEFALRFIRGDFNHADPGRGRFRDLVKTVLYHLVVDHSRGRRFLPLSGDGDQVPAAPAVEETDEEFLRLWRAELFDRAWEELRKLEATTGRPVYSVLRWRVNNPKRSAADGASELERHLPGPVTPDGFRQWLHRARIEFARLLREEVAFSVGARSPEDIEAELGDLGLLSYFPTTGRSVPANTAR